MKFYILRNEAGDGGDGGGDGGSAGSTTLLDGQQSSQASQQSQGGQQQQQQQSSGAFDFRSLVGDDGRFIQGFTDKLPDNLKEHAKHFSKYQTPLHALEHTLNLQQLLGKKADAVVIPGPDATEEEWQPVLKKLGVPDSPDGYGLKIPEGLPEGVKVSEEEIKGFATLAHQLRLTPQQVAKLQEYDISRVTQAVGTQQEQIQALEVEMFNKEKEILKKEWGTGPEALKKQALAERAALTFGFTPEDIKNEPLFRNAKFVLTLAKAGAAMSEDTLAQAGDLSTSGSLKSKAQDIISNPSNPLYKRYWDGDEDVNSQVRNWMRAG